MILRRRTHPVIPNLSSGSEETCAYYKGRFRGSTRPYPHIFPEVVQEMARSLTHTLQQSVVLDCETRVDQRYVN